MNPLRVLLVEDSQPDRDITRLQLSRIAPEEFEIVFAENLKTALEKLGSANFDAVLADLNLPDSRGLDTVKAILALHPTVPMVVYTGDLNPLLGMAAVKLGAQDFVTKGVTDAATLANRIRFAAARKSPPPAKPS